MGRVGPQVRGGVTVLDRASAPSTAFGGPPPPASQGRIEGAGGRDVVFSLA